ncbi:MAG: ribosome-associated translation inhibitor RaiA [Chloroflexota bacterium]
MDLHITGTNLEITAELRRWVERKIGKLTRYLPNAREARVEFSEESTKSVQEHYLVRGTISAKGVVFHGEERGEDLLGSVDRLAASFTSQIEHYKGKRSKTRNASPAKNEPLPAAPPAPAASRRVVKVKRFAVKPMTPAEAVEQMEALGHDFFIFFDGETEEVKLIYRRKDGDYGMIEPVPG